MHAREEKLCIRHEERRAREMRGGGGWRPLVTPIPIPVSLCQVDNERRGPVWLSYSIWPPGGYSWREAEG